MTTFLWMAVMVLAAVAFVGLVRRLPPALALAGFLLAIPAAFVWRSTGADRPSLFSLVKLASVLVGAGYLQVLRMTRWSERPLGRVPVHALLAVNILEAVVAEGAQGGIANALAGVVLVLTQASPAGVSRGVGGVRYPLGGPWIAAYTLWNFAFVYGRVDHGVAGAFAGLAVVHLLAPLLAMGGDTDRYIEARAYALGLLVVVRVVAPRAPYLHLTPEWHSPALAAGLHVASLVLAVGVAALALGRARRPAPASSGPSPTLLA